MEYFNNPGIQKPKIVHLAHFRGFFVSMTVKLIINLVNKKKKKTTS